MIVVQRQSYQLRGSVILSINGFVSLRQNRFHKNCIPVQLPSYPSYTLILSICKNSTVAVASYSTNRAAKKSTTSTAIATFIKLIPKPFRFPHKNSAAATSQIQTTTTLIATKMQALALSYIQVNISGSPIIHADQVCKPRRKDSAKSSQHRPAVLIWRIVHNDHSSPYRNRRNDRTIHPSSLRNREEQGFEDPYDIRDQGQYSSGSQGNQARRRDVGQPYLNLVLLPSAGRRRQNQDNRQSANDRRPDRDEFGNWRDWKGRNGR